jgi:P27 family predicted phage terminase small subunit
MDMEAIEGTGLIVAEPDWTVLFSDVLDVASASSHWQRLTTELRQRQLLASANGHSLQRLVISYVVYDRAAREVAENGAVTKPRRGNSKAIARVSPHFTVMRQAGSDADQIEAELGIAPRRRAAATKVEHGKKAPRAADRFLRSVS